MTGYAIPGTMGFVPKDGGFDARLNVRLHSDDLAKIRALKKRGESDADYIRAALREKMLRDARERCTTATA